MRRVAFDQSTKVTGYSVFDEEKLVEYGVFDFSKEKESKGRLTHMLHSVYDLICKQNPDIIIFEDVQLQGNPKALIALAQLQGCIIAISIMKHVPYCVLHPSTWRRIIGIEQYRVKREELKRSAVSFVKKKISYSCYG